MLLTPQRELTVELVVQMDNGEIEVFNAYRVQHNNSRGPYKVGARGRQLPAGCQRALR
jgi:glutamate dehydrogenase (NAD(P)+)